jgi:FlaA1/EpsC-like NDP-sugar epimerase
MVRASSLEKVLLLLADVLALFLCFYLAFWLQFHSGWIVDKLDLTRDFSRYHNASALVLVSWICIFAFTGLYRKWLLESRLFQILTVVRAVVYGLVFVIVALFGLEVVSRIFSPGAFSEGFLYGSRIKLILAYGLLIVVIVSLFRLCVQFFLRKLLSQGFGADRILVLGANALGDDIVSQLSKNPQLGQMVVGFVDERSSSMNSGTYGGLPIFGKYSDLPKIIRKEKIAGIIIAHESSSIREVLRVFDWVADLPIHIYVIPDLYDVVAGHFKGNLVHGVELQEVFAFNMAPWQVQVKRLIDITVALSLLVLTAPMLLLTAILIKWDSNGP